MRRPQLALASAILIALLTACSTGGTPTTVAPTAAVATAAASSAPSTTASSAPSVAPSTAVSAAATVAATRPAGTSSPVASPGNPVATASRAAATRTTTATASNGVLLRGLIEQGGTLTVAALQALPSETIQVTFLSGTNTEQHSYTGVHLYTVLNNAKLRVNNDRYKNDKLRKSIVATGSDNYEATIAWGEIDPDFGNAPILIAWAEDGKPLSGAGGPLRLVVPTDKRGGRYVSGLVTLDVRDPDSPAR